MDYEQFLTKVARNLRAARQLKGLTLYEAASGVSGSEGSGRGAYRYLWELEKGLRNPSLQMLYKLASRYGVSVADLADVPGARHGQVGLAELKVKRRVQADAKPRRKPSS